MSRNIPGGGSPRNLISRIVASMALAIWITAIVAPIGRDCSAYAADSATSTVPDDNVTFSIPTTIPFAIKADGSTICPDRLEDVCRFWFATRKDKRIQRDRLPDWRIDKRGERRVLDLVTQRDRCGRWKISL